MPAAAPPNPSRRRLFLRCALVALPILAVGALALLGARFFGDRPAPENTAAFDALRGSLEQAARAGLPDDPAALSLGARFDALTLVCPPETAEARLEALRGFAAQCQGTTLDQPADADGARRLLVELPETSVARFRELALGSLRGGVPPPALPPPAAATAMMPPDAATAPKVFLNVTLAPPPAPPGGPQPTPTTTAAIQTAP